MNNKLSFVCFSLIANALLLNGCAGDRPKKPVFPRVVSTEPQTDRSTAPETIAPSSPQTSETSETPVTENVEDLTRETEMVIGSVEGEVPAAMPESDEEGNPCDLGALVVRTEMTLMPLPECEEFTLDRLRVFREASLTLEPGVRLVFATSERGSASMEVNGNFEARGTETEPVTIHGPSNGLSVYLRNNVDLNSVTFSNATVYSHSIAPKDTSRQKFTKMTIDNSETQGSLSALNLFHPGIETFSGVIIKTNDHSLALRVSSDALSHIDSENLKIESANEKKIELHLNTLSTQEYSVKIPNLGSPYYIENSRILRANDLKIESGVEFRVCETCTIKILAKSVEIGSNEGAPVAFKGQNGKPWMGLDFVATKMKIDVNNVSIQDAQGVADGHCGKAVIRIHEGAEVSIGQAEVNNIDQLFVVDESTNVIFQKDAKITGTFNETPCTVNPS